jgi:hypothetical protein
MDSMLVNVRLASQQENQQTIMHKECEIRRRPMKQDLIERLKKRAEIRRQIPTRKSVQEGQPDRIADLLEEAASALRELKEYLDSSFYLHQYYEKIGTPSQSRRWSKEYNEEMLQAERLKGLNKL